MLLSAAAALLLPTGGCAITDVANANTMNAAQPYVLNAAERDLACPMEQLRVRREVGNRYVVEGCGRRTTYGGVCEQLQCAVYEQGDEPPAWRDRPEPDTIESQR